MGKKGKVKNYARHRLLSISSDEGDDYEEPHIRGKPTPMYYHPKTENQKLFLESLNSP